MTNDTTRIWGWFILTAAVAACGGGGGGSAGGDKGGDPPVFSAVDPSKVCPAGYVGWDFATGTSFEDIPKAIKIESAACVVTGADGGAQTSDRTSAAKAACDGKQSCGLDVDCMGQVVTKWTCGDDVAELSNTTAGGSTSQIACILATADGGAPALASPTGKACVPKVCPGNQRRDANMNCVADVAKPTFNPGTFVALTMNPAQDVQPVGGGFVDNTSYEFVLRGYVRIATSPTGRGDPLEGYGDSQGTIWLTDRFARVKADQTTDDKDFVEGFRCEATKLSLTVPKYRLGYVDEHGVLQPDKDEVTFRLTTRLSKECTDPRVTPNAADNAAIRAGLKAADFAAKYRYVGTYAHVSVDMEGTTLPPTSGSGLTACAVNPPGFYYHPAEAYVDRIGYYQQRELGADKTVVSKVLTATSAQPTRIEVGVTSASFREPEFTANVYGDDLPVMQTDVSWYLAGDNPRNPYSPSANVDNFQNLTRRNLRASMFFHLRRPTSNPDSTAKNPTEKILVSSVALPQNLHSPTGATAPMKFKIPKKIKDLMFSTYSGWGTYDWIPAEVCLTAEGLDPTVGASELPVVNVDGTIFRAGLAKTASCAPATILHVVRDYKRRPLSPTAKTADVSLTRDTGTGDSKSSSTTTNDSDRSCDNGDCTTTRETGLATGGLVHRQIFDVITHVITVDTDSSSSVQTDASAEAMGFQVVDVDDAAQKQEFADRASTPANGVHIEVAPNWDLLIEQLRKLSGKSPVEWQSGKYGGVMGLGVGIGYKIPLTTGPIPGLITISLSAGLSIAVQVEVKYRPDSPEDAYPCITDDPSRRCYGVVGAADPMDQLTAQGKCGAKGGRLAEVHSLEDLQNLRGYLNGGAAGDQVWLGAQLAYQYPSPSCGDDFNGAGCATGTATSFRWLSDDSEFASKTGTGTATLAGDAVGVLSAGADLKSLAPALGGVIFDNTTGEIKSAPGDKTLAAVCEFDPASAASFLNFSTGVHLGGGAGLGVSFCTPTEDIGFCIEGHLNFIDVSITPEVGVTNFLIFRKDAATGKNRLFGLRGNTYSDAPVDVRLLSGSIDAVVNFYIGSATWTIVEYPGFALFGTNLYEKNNPFSENY